MQHLTVITTGGTSDKVYCDAKADYRVDAVQSLGVGVWIAMNGRIRNPTRVRENRGGNRFEEATN
jgi:L-asparaginase